MMRTLILAAAMSAMGVAAPSAQTPPAPVAGPALPMAPLGPPRAFQGYSQPDINAGMCRVVNTGQAVCTFPAMTAGRYLIRTSGTSTALNGKATQKIAIQIAGRGCGVAERKPTAQAPWTSGAKTIRLNCETQVVTDRPLTVQVFYGDANATRSPAGPTLVIERLPWDGVLSAQVSPVQQQ